MFDYIFYYNYKIKVRYRKVRKILVKGLEKVRKILVKSQEKVRKTLIKSQEKLVSFTCGNPVYIYIRFDHTNSMVTLGRLRPVLSWLGHISQ